WSGVSGGVLTCVGNHARAGATRTWAPASQSDQRLHYLDGDVWGASGRPPGLRAVLRVRSFPAGSLVRFPCLGRRDGKSWGRAGHHDLYLVVFAETPVQLDRAR